MLRIALTGGLASGKSHVRARFEALGVPTIDADLLARDVVAPGTPGLAAVVNRFGPTVLDVDGRLHRSRLAAIVFGDEQARRDLEAIIHPLVYAAIEQWFEEKAESRGGASAFAEAPADTSAAPDAQPAPLLAVADIPLLYETGATGAFDVVIVAFCPPDLQLRRARERDGLSEEAVRQRLAAQWPIDEKARRADYVIRTDGTRAETDAQVTALLDVLKSRAAPP